MVLTFSQGARGAIIKSMQLELEAKLGRRLEGGCDGTYGVHTTQAVQEMARRVMSNKPNPSTAGETPAPLIRSLADEGALEGFAGEVFFERVLGIAWPADFARCLQLTMRFEGTGFQGAEGPKQTGDDAGVTFGAIGFTSYNDELQELLREAMKTNCPVFQDLAVRCLNDKDRVTFYSVIASGAEACKFAQWGLMYDGDVRPTLRVFLRALGDHDWFKALQVTWARDRYWYRACEQAAALWPHGVVPVRAKALLFDLAVQNGGLKRVEVEALQLLFRAQGGLSDRQKMLAVRDAIVARLQHKQSKWVRDVSARKTTICNGIGTVHGAEIKVGAYAL